MPSFVAPLAGLILALSAASSAGFAAGGDNGPWLLALSSTFVVIDTATGDLDGDGREESVICYREDTGRTQQLGGIAVLAGKGAALKPVFHVELEDALCEKVKVNGRKLGILLAGNKQLVWTYGEQLKFRQDQNGLLGGLTAKASSSMGSHGADKAIDGDLSTSWAEGSPGTGIGQTVTLHLAKPTDIGVIGIYGGNGASSRAYFDSNRIHRGSVEAKTEADMGDSAAGVDFSTLGIDSMGDRIEFSSENKPQVTYVRIAKRGVVELQIRIESVYLGDKKDDAHIAEIEVVPVLSLQETLDRATSVKSKGAVKTDRKVEPAAVVPVTDEAMKKLDEGGRSLVNDDDVL